jgi:hypothetical protein
MEQVIDVSLAMPTPHVRSKTSHPPMNAILHQEARADLLQATYEWVQVAWPIVGRCLVDTQAEFMCTGASGGPEIRDPGRGRGANAATACRRHGGYPAAARIPAVSAAGGGSGAATATGGKRGRRPLRGRGQPLGDASASASDEDGDLEAPVAVGHALEAGRAAGGGRSEEEPMEGLAEGEAAMSLPASLEEQCVRGVKERVRVRVRVWYQKLLWLVAPHRGVSEHDVMSLCSLLMPAFSENSLLLSVRTFHW